MGETRETSFPPGRWVRVAIVFLALSYAFGAAIVAYLELDGAVLSRRFDIPSVLVLGTCIAQLACAAGLLAARWRRPALIILTLTAIGAIGLHLRIGSPATALPAVAYALLQLWLLGRLSAGRKPAKPLK